MRYLVFVPAWFLEKVSLKGITKTWIDSEVISLTNKHDDLFYASNLRFGTCELGTDKDLLRASKVILKNLIQK